MKHRGLLALKKYPEFLKIWLGRLVSRFGDSIDQIAFMWLVYELTGSGLLMGAFLAVNFLPNLIFGILGGVLADRLSKKSLMLVGDIGRGLVVALTAVLYWQGHMRVWYLFVFTFVNSTLETFAAPARTSAVPLLVTEKEDFLAANSLFTASSSLMSMLGLGAAGVIIGTWGIGAAIAVDAVTFFICALSVALARIPAGIRDRQSTKGTTGFGHDLREGLSMAFGHGTLRLCILLGVALNAFISPFYVLAPIYADRVLQAGAKGYSALNMAISASLMVGALLVGQYGQRLGLRRLIIIGTALKSLGFIGLFFASRLLFAVPISCLIGFGVSAIGSSISTLVLTKCDREFLGRVSSVMNSTMMAAMPASTAVAGALVQLYGPAPLLGVIGLLVLATGLAVGLSSALRDAVVTESVAPVSS